MSWYLAKSLDVLRNQINLEFPKRSKSSDGTIGDARHRATKSDHNPDPDGAVRALDITNDPKNGVRSKAIADALVASRDPRILNIISDGMIISSEVSPWVWRPYHGVNSHHQHVHISVNKAKKNDISPWNLGDLAKPPVMVKQPDAPPLPPPVVVNPEARQVAAKMILDFEARRDPKTGHLMVYRPPANDGGGAYEVGGLNARYNPKEAARLAELLGQKKYKEAEDYAIEAIAKNTDPAAKWAVNPGVQFVFRDTYFNRGPRGSAITIQHAVGATEDGIVGPKTLKAVADMPPVKLIDQMRIAREWYERKHVGVRANFWQGLVNRWNHATAAAKVLRQKLEV